VHLMAVAYCGRHIFTGKHPGSPSAMLYESQGIEMIMTKVLK
jgi:hypothetical protein